MDSKVQRQWLEYWRRSLKDAEKANIEIEDYQRKTKGRGIYEQDFILIDNFCPYDECIPDNDEIKRAFAEILDRLKKKETDVFISPFLLKKSQKLNSAFSPFWYIAHIDSEGRLSIPEDTIPIIPRKYLSPTVDNAFDENLVLGDLDVAEKAIANNHDGQFENYEEYQGQKTPSFYSETKGFSRIRIRLPGNCTK